MTIYERLYHIVESVFMTVSSKSCACRNIHDKLIVVPNVSWNKLAVCRSNCLAINN